MYALKIADLIVHPRIVRCYTMDELMYSIGCELVLILLFICSSTLMHGQTLQDLYYILVRIHATHLVLSFV